MIGLNPVHTPSIQLYYDTTTPMRIQKQNNTEYDKKCLRFIKITIQTIQFTHRGNTTVISGYIALITLEREPVGFTNHIIKACGDSIYYHYSNNTYSKTYPSSNLTTDREQLHISDDFLKPEKELQNYIQSKNYSANIKTYRYTQNGTFQFDSPTNQHKDSHFIGSIQKLTTHTKKIPVSKYWQIIEVFFITMFIINFIASIYLFKSEQKINNSTIQHFTQSRYNYKILFSTFDIVYAMYGLNFVQSELWTTFPYGINNKEDYKVLATKVLSDQTENALHEIQEIETQQKALYNAYISQKELVYQYVSNQESQYQSTFYYLFNKIVANSFAMLEDVSKISQNNTNAYFVYKNSIISVNNYINQIEEVNNKLYSASIQNTMRVNKIIVYCSIFVNLLLAIIIIIMYKRFLAERNYFAQLFIQFPSYVIKRFKSKCSNFLQLYSHVTLSTTVKIKQRYISNMCCFVVLVVLALLINTLLLSFSKDYNTSLVQESNEVISMLGIFAELISIGHSTLNEIILSILNWETINEEFIILQNVTNKILAGGNKISEIENAIRTSSPYGYMSEILSNFNEQMFKEDICNITANITLSNINICYNILPNIMHQVCDLYQGLSPMYHSIFESLKLLNLDLEKYKANKISQSTISNNQEIKNISMLLCRILIVHTSQTSVHYHLN